jgi:crotonobetainyl-CoA:carnitine CoA-transferase CaiB-like acyl-CoA transferase
MPVDVGGLPYRAAPMMGEDNDHVYRDILGLTSAEIATLREEWII